MSFFLCHKTHRIYPNTTRDMIIHAESCLQATAGIRFIQYREWQRSRVALRFDNGAYICIKELDKVLGSLIPKRYGDRPLYQDTYWGKPISDDKVNKDFNEADCSFQLDDWNSVQLQQGMLTHICPFDISRLMYCHYYSIP